MWIADKIYYLNSSNFIRAYQGDELVWDKNLVPLMFTAKANNSSIGLQKLSSLQTLEYSTDGNTWSNMTTATTISLTSGQSVYIRGILRFNNQFTDYTQFTMSGDIKASGNINYLWNKDNPDTALKDLCGYYLFRDCIALSDVSELELPATTLAMWCYDGMFRGCTSLTTAPVLPATRLALGCYMSMFQDCTALTTAPTLPATTLAQYCYMSMFYNCTSLTTTPELLSTTLARGCYQNMFDGCTSLTTAPELPATTLAEYCYKEMFKGCRSLTTAPVLPATTLAVESYLKMFSGCTNLNYIKCLATDISASGCTSDWVNGVASTGTFVKASSMSSWTRGNNGIPTNWTIVNDEVSAVKFTAKANSSSVGLTKISTGQTIEYSTNGITWTNMTTATSISLSSGQSVYMRGMLTSDNTDSNYTNFNLTGKFKVSGNINYLWNKDNPDSLLKNWCGFNLFRSCTALIDASELELPSMTLAERCYSCMFIYDSGLTEAPALPATTMANDCYRGMFQDCSGLTTAPELPAPTLAPRCYRSMFYACQNLSYIKCLATNISATDCTIYWTEKVKSSGTFVKASSMSSWRRGNSGIPSGWTIENA